MKIGYVDGSALIRAHEQDSLFKQTIYQCLDSLMNRVDRDDLEAITSLIYYGLTTGRGWSTVGEAACGMRLVDPRIGNYPHLSKRVAWILLHVTFPWIISKWSGWMPTPQSSLLARCLSHSFRVITQYWHLAAFYWQPQAPFYDWSKRLLGLRYIRWPPKPPPRSSHSLLPRLVALTLALVGTAELIQGIRDTISDLSQLREVDSTCQECMLCLSSLRSPTVVPCGHVFCWSCIGKWLDTQKTSCPLCRQSFKPAQLFILQQ